MTPRRANGLSPQSALGSGTESGSCGVVSARRASSEIISPMVFRSRLARSLAACRTSSAMSSVVLMHQMLAHHASLVKSNRECVGRCDIYGVKLVFWRITQITRQNALVDGAQAWLLAHKDSPFRNCTTFSVALKMPL